jgi:hypothetical protein
MTTGVDGATRDTRTVDATRDTRDVGAVDEAARADLSAAADAVPDTAADAVADRVVGDVDAVEPTDAAAPAEAVDPPTTEPTPEHRAAADRFNAELQAIDDARDLEPQRTRSEVLGRIGEYAQGIPDLAERDRFVRAVAPEAGRAAGLLAGRSPSEALARLNGIGQGVTADTGRLLAREAISTGPGRDNLVPMGMRGTPVGDALTEARHGQMQRLGEVVGGAARFAIPGVDAAANLIEGNVEGAIASAGIDLAGGALLRGGRLAAGAVAAGVALAPDTAQAGALSRLTMRFGDEAVEIEARVGRVNGRTPTFDVAVPGRFSDGTQGTLRLADPRGKHNALGGFDDANLARVARDINRGNAPGNLGITRSAAQFTGRYNTVEGQAELARLVMARVSPADLARVGQSGGRLDVPLDRVVGLTPIAGNRVAPATSVRVMRNNDGSFHLVPMP